ncbi:MAG: nicotinate (nicotinamide) nucleotide adenylyltransferase [Fibrobacterota bacterium]
MTQQQTTRTNNHYRKASGILGGSFDPVHLGHLAIARLAFEELQLQEILFIPNRIPPHKKQTIHATASQRLTMLRLACTNDQSFRIWEGELQREGPSYTVDTLSILRRSYPETRFYFIIGTDNLMELPSWHRYNDIISQVTLAVADRPGHSFEIPEQLRPAKIVRFSSPYWGVSSTEIRRLRLQGFSCRYLIPEPVRTFIDTEGLYKKGQDRTDESAKPQDSEES